MRALQGGREGEGGRGREKEGGRRREREKERKGGRGMAFDSTTLLMDRQYRVTKYDCLPIRGEEAPLLPPKHMYIYLPYARTIDSSD